MSKWSVLTFWAYLLETCLTASVQHFYFQIPTVFVRIHNLLEERPFGNVTALGQK
jgi:hypothetical protein